MSLEVETGIGKNNANAYVSLKECDDYHLEFGNEDWIIISDDEGNVKMRENAIKKATSFIDAKYGNRFKGTRKTSEQSLLFPRVNYTDDRGKYVKDIPKAIKTATCEAALRVFTGIEMMPDIERGGKVISEKVGPISVSYSGGAPSGMKFDYIDSVLRDVLLGGGTVKMRRG